MSRTMKEVATLKLIHQLSLLVNSQQDFNLSMLKCMLDVVSALPEDAQGALAPQVIAMVAQTKKLQKQQREVVGELTHELAKHD